MSSSFERPFEWFRQARRSSLYFDRLSAFKRAPHQLPKILGHRGARHAEPENTLRAFDRALQEGADGVEIDVRMTGDGELIVVHDPELPGELAGRRSPVKYSELSASQVAEIRLAKGERIPTLQQVLAWQRETNAWLNVELKGDVPSQEHVTRTACALLSRQEPHSANRLLISSFHPRMLLECSLRLPDIPTCWLVHAGQRLLKTAPGWRWTGAAGVHPQCRDLSSRRLDELLTAGAIVNVWTVNEPPDAVRLARAGVDGLITDVPGLILRALQNQL